MEHARVSFAAIKADRRWRRESWRNGLHCLCFQDLVSIDILDLIHAVGDV